ncbi:MAG: PG0541 family transporter-associated protein [Acidobacteriota bacterium]
MKLLMIVVDSECREELEVLFKKVGVAGYTEIPEVHGVGETGIRMGSGAYPETSSLFFTIVKAEKVSELKEAVSSFCGAFERHMKMVQWGVEEVS